VVVWFALCCGLLDGMAPRVWGQGARSKKGTVEKTEHEGKVTQVEVKGKTVHLTVELDGRSEPVDLLLTPKMRITVSAPGDASLFQPRAIVGSSSVFESNKELFTRKVDVYLGSLAPKPGIQRVANAGETYQVVGAVVASDDQSVTLNVEGNPRKLRFENGEAPEVWLHASDLELIRAESTIKIQGAFRGDKLVAQQVAVTLANPLTADELAGKKEKKPRATAKSAAKSKKASKGEKGEPADKGAAEDPETDDPFGLLKTKKDPGAGGKPPVDDAAKTEPDTAADDVAP